MIDFQNHKYNNEIFNNINSITFSCDNLSNKNQTRENFDPIRFKNNINYIKKTLSTCMYNNIIDIHQRFT